MKKYLLIPLISSAVALSGCGTLTGIPSHGGGKRFAIEQELVAGASRAAIKDIEIDTLKGKNVALFIVGMGDQGSGNMIGGRASLSAAFRGQHVNTPSVEYPVINTTTTTGATITTAENALNAAKKTKGVGHSTYVDMKYSGLGAYRNATILNPNDAKFLSAVMQEFLLLKGVNITSPNQAQYSIYVNVDVFGTIRSRTDWLFKNNESLKAKAAFELTVIDNKTGKVFIAPQVVSYEAEYKEEYILWMGPTEATKTIMKSDGLLSDFQEINTSEFANNE